MASLSQYSYPDYIFSNPLLLDALCSSDGSSGSAAATASMHWAAGEVNNYQLPLIADNYSITCFNNNIDIDPMVLPLDHYSCSDISSSSTTTTAFFGGLDYSSTFWPAPPPPATYPIIAGAENWEGGIDGAGQDPCTVKVRRYSAEEKKHRIIRYLKKKRQRNFNKTIKYACRKNLADKRVRVRGRFAKNKSHHEVACSSDDDQYQNLAHSCYNLTTTTTHLQMKTAAAASEEEWVQEAIASLMYYGIPPDGSSIS